MGNLTVARVKSLAKPGWYGDGGTLYLVIAPGGSKQWVQRITIHGKRHDLGLGGFPLGSLAEARDKEFDNRRKARAGGGPLAEKRKATMPTFREAAEKTYQANLRRWRSGKTAKNQKQGMEKHAFPILGDLPVDRIGRERKPCGCWRRSGPRDRKSPEISPANAATFQWCIAHGVHRARSRRRGSERRVAEHTARQSALSGAALRRGGVGPRGDSFVRGERYDEAGVSLPGADGGSIRRGPRCAVVRDRPRPRRADVDYPRRAYEGGIRASRSVVGRSPRHAPRGRAAGRPERPDLSFPAMQGAIGQHAVEAAAQSPHRLDASRFPQLVPRLARPSAALRGNWPRPRLPTLWAESKARQRQKTPPFGGVFRYGSLRSR